MCETLDIHLTFQCFAVFSQVKDLGKVLVSLYLPCNVLWHRLGLYTGCVCLWAICFCFYFLYAIFFVDYICDLEIFFVDLVDG